MSNPKYRVGQYAKCKCGCMDTYDKIYGVFKSTFYNTWIYTLGPGAGVGVIEHDIILRDCRKDFTTRNAKNLPGAKINGR